MNINNLIIEVTRKCNLSCEHCLRGDAQPKNIKIEYIDSLLDQVEYINSVTFSGGEPTINIPAIRYFLEKAKSNNIAIGSFYIATNGYNITPDFILLLLELYLYCDEKEICAIEYSNDIFHNSASRHKNFELLKALSFFRNKFDEDQYNYRTYTSLIAEGRTVENFGNGRKNHSYMIDTKENFNEAEIYLNVNGFIINGCDWSYKSQNNNKICHVNELTNFYNELSEE